ncbi:MAG: tRNA (adenosine(37)-N6)-threonylcarbamoyltransferase complex ATPase subunit type 1 TsaE [Clostridia bacterium]|jgi:tRNA threonylcarbamoyladenosine biosynthesis protein TsaE|nr:tRNA (adenosine(37)-N6)-threonylcarbamoyltransferase complex ATPase subunit type 1 TsaE [Clostridia bacterium]
MKELIISQATQNAAQTETLGRTLAEQMLADETLPPFIALYGDLGVGKTAFVRGFTSRISPEALVRSPTFALVNEYRAKPRSVFHFDMYRITDEDDLFSIGYYDYLNRPGICLVEWSENIPYAIPEMYIRVVIEKSDPAQPDLRTVIIELTDEAPDGADL